MPLFVRSEIGRPAWDDMGVPASHGSAEPLWRAIAVYRFASLGYAVLLAIVNRGHYARFDWAWVVIVVMTAWTAGTTVAYARPERRTPVLLGADLAVTAGLLLSTFALQYPQAIRHGVMPVTGIWVAGPVLAWAVCCRTAPCRTTCRTRWAPGAVVAGRKSQAGVNYVAIRDIRRMGGCWAGITGRVKLQTIEARGRGA
jgi:uncharacterized protein DUF5931